LNNPFIIDYRIWITALLSSGLGVLLITLSSFFDKKPLLLLAWPLSALFLIFMVIQPKWTAVLILFLRPLLDVLLNLTKVDVGGEGVGIGVILNLMIILLAIFLAFYTLNFPQNVFPVYCWVFFLVFMLITVSYSPVPRDGLRLLFNYLSYFAMFILPFLMIKNEDDFLFWIKILGLSFLLPIFCANIDMLRGGHYFEDAGNRIMGTFTHPNILAFYLVLAFTFYFYILSAGFLDSKPLVTLIIKAILLDILVLLVATKTRNAWVSVYAGFVIYGFLKDKKTLLFLIGMVPLLLIIPDVWQRISNLWNGDTGNNYHGVNSLEWRIQLWQVSWTKILERPIQGYGLASFQPSEEVFFPTAKGMHAHNAYLETLFETGIIGLMSFVALFLGPLYIFLRNMCLSVTKTQARIWAIMVGYIISYMLICSADNLSFYLAFNWYVWFFIGLMLVASYRHYSVCVN